jgi:hypothetical protein
VHPWRFEKGGHPAGALPGSVVGLNQPMDAGRCLRSGHKENAMKKAWVGVWVLSVLCILGVARAESPHRLGAGAYYWVAVENLDDEFEEDGLSYYATYQFKPSLLGLQLDLEVHPDRFEKTAYAPQAHLVLGGTLYAAAGIGILYMDDTWADEPFYSFKAGLDLELLPNLRLDINANYRFNDTADLSDKSRNIDTDTVFLGAALRFAF